VSAEWRYLVDENIVEFILDFSLPDVSGREISFVTYEGFQIGFWLDHFVKEVRVVDLDRV